MTTLAMVRGRSVAVVGRAASIRGTGMGEAIDEAEVVVRINAMLPLDATLAADIGTRTDVIYHCAGCMDVRDQARRLRVRAIRVDTALRRTLAIRAGRTPAQYLPFTGTVAVFDSLRHGARSVLIAGMDLGATGHSVQGSRNRWREGAFTPPGGGRWAHDPAGDRDLLSGLLRTEPTRVRCDAALARVLEAA